MFQPRLNLLYSTQWMRLLKTIFFLYKIDVSAVFSVMILLVSDSCLHLFTEIRISPDVKESGFWNPANVRLWNPESIVWNPEPTYFDIIKDPFRWTREFGIHDSGSGIHYSESGIQGLGSGIQGPPNKKNKE